MRQVLMAVEMPSQSIQYYIIKMPTGTEYQAYQQSKSLSHFILRDKFCFEIITHTDNHVIQGWIQKIEEAGNSTINPITCNGVYDFYNKIGYDKKKKKYIDQLKEQI